MIFPQKAQHLWVKEWMFCLKKGEIVLMKPSNTFTKNVTKIEMKVLTIFSTILSNVLFTCTER